MLVAWRDYVKDATLTLLASTAFSAGAPIENLKDRRLGLPAVGTSTVGMNSFVNFKVEFDDEKTLRLIAFLAHNMGVEFVSSGLEIVGYNAMDVAQFEIHLAGDMWLPPADSQFPRNLFIDLGQDYDSIKYFVVQYFDATTDEDYRWICGRLWAGPIFTPTYRTSHNDFTMSTLDDSVLNKSQGQQAYADYRPRFRGLHVATVLTEDEAIGTEDGLTPNLQDIGFECGKAGEVIVIPSVASNHLIHKYGVYGHFDEPPAINLRDTNKRLGRLYTTEFDVIEDL